MFKPVVWKASLCKRVGTVFFQLKLRHGLKMNYFEVQNMDLEFWHLV